MGCIAAETLPCTLDSACVARSTPRLPIAISCVLFARPCVRSLRLTGMRHGSVCNELRRKYHQAHDHVWPYLARHCHLAPLDCLAAADARRRVTAWRHQTSDQHRITHANPTLTLQCLRSQTYLLQGGELAHQHVQLAAQVQQLLVDSAALPLDRPPGAGSEPAS